MSSTYPESGTVPFAKLQARHQKELERQRVILSAPFQKRAEILVKRIQKELPNVGDLVYCNGDSWLVPVDWPNEKPEARMIPHVDSDGQTVTEDGKPVVDTLRDALFRAWANELHRPNVSARCLADMVELHDLCGYCEDENLDVPTTI